MEEKDPKWIRMTMALSSKRIEFKGDIVSLMFTPIVYVVFGKSNVLYVGMSTKGICRLFDRRHHVLTEAVWKEAVSVQVFAVHSRAAALTLEECMIQEFKPVCNDRMCTHNAREARKRLNKSVSAVIEAYA